MGVKCSTHGRNGKCIQKFWSGKPEGKILLGRQMGRWEGNIRMDLREIGWIDVD